MKRLNNNGATPQWQGSYEVGRPLLPCGPSPFASSQHRPHGKKHRCDRGGMKVCQSCGRRYPDNAIRCPEDGAALVELTPATMPSPENLVGRRMFGDYIIEQKLGEGGMGSVYLAKHLTIDQSIAIKVLHGHANDSSE